MVVGERDHKFTKIASAMAREIPASEVVIVPGAGHAVHLERPFDVARIVRSYTVSAPKQQ